MLPAPPRWCFTGADAGDKRDGRIDATPVAGGDCPVHDIGHRTGAHRQPRAAVVAQRGLSAECGHARRLGVLPARGGRRRGRDRRPPDPGRRAWRGCPRGRLHGVHRPPARRPLWRARLALHAGAVPRGRAAEPGFAVAADAAPAIPAGAGGTRGILPRQLRQPRVRATGRRRPGPAADGHGEGRDKAGGLRQPDAVPCAVRQHHGGVPSPTRCTAATATWSAGLSWASLAGATTTATS